MPDQVTKLPVQNATLPISAGTDWIGVWQDQSTGNPWSGLPFIGNNVSTVNQWYVSGAGSEFKPGIVIRFQINAVIDYSKTNNPLGQSYLLSEWGRKPLAGERTRHEPGNPERSSGGKLRTIWGRENAYFDIDSMMGFVEGQPYIEITTT